MKRTLVLAVAVGALVVVVGTAVVTLVLLRTTYQDFEIPSGSMRPTLDVGDQVLVKRHTHARDGDIVVFRGTTFGAGGARQGDYVKRVIGTGGQTVACCTEGKVTRNGVPLDEPYLMPDDVDPSARFPATTVPAGRLWVLGDNRGNSSDSRFHINDEFHGTIAEADVIGRVIAHGGRGTTYGYVMKRAALVAGALGLLSAVVVGLASRFSPDRELDIDPVWSPGRTMEGP